MNFIESYDVRGAFNCSASNAARVAATGCQSPYNLNPFFLNPIIVRLQACHSSVRRLPRARLGPHKVRDDEVSVSAGLQKPHVGLPVRIYNSECVLPTVF